MSDVLVEIDRAFPIGGRTHPVGARVRVSRSTFERMLSANPPFAHAVEDQEAEESGQAFSAAAVGKLAALGIGLDAYDGEVTGADGRVVSRDVEAWLAERDQPPTEDGGEQDEGEDEDDG